MRQQAPLDDTFLVDHLRTQKRDGASAVVGSVAGLMKNGAELRLLVSSAVRDGFGEVTPSVITSRCANYVQYGLRLVDARWASSEVVRDSRSAWAKRLGVRRTRPAVIARYRRDAT